VKNFLGENYTVIIRASQSHVISGIKEIFGNCRFLLTYLEIMSIIGNKKMFCSLEIANKGGDVSGVKECQEGRRDW